MKRTSKYILWCLLIGGIVSLLTACVSKEYSRIIGSQQKTEDQTLVINEVLTDNMGGLQDEDGDYTDWIEIYNYGDESINLEGFGLSDDLDEPLAWKFPSVVIESKGFLLIRASGKDKKEEASFLHTNFKISQDGENIVLSDKEGITIDQIAVPKLKKNISYGRKPDGSSNLCILSGVTPNATNNEVSVLLKTVTEQRLETPVFSYEAGFYDHEIQLEIKVEDKDTIIFYTLDGSEPGLNSFIYKNPISIHSRAGEKCVLSQIKKPGMLSIFTTYAQAADEIYMGTVVRARTYKEGILSDEIVTNTYFINPQYTLPIISLVTEEENLFDDEKGIYVPGEIYQIGKKVQYGQVAGNYYQSGKEWERKAHLEFFETDGKKYIDQDVGIRISGMFSRAYLCKSLKIYARKEYDDKKTIDYSIFPDLKNSIGEEINSFRRLKLRNSGEDFNKTMFKDAFMQSLIGEIGLDTQAYRPCILFIDGEYWGIHNIRECLDEYYVEEHYGIDKDDVVILQRAETKDRMGVGAGKEEDIESYNQLINFVKENDMSKEENYKYIKTQMDIDNFIDYNVAEIYIGNLDWPDNNVKIWRKRLDTNKEELDSADGRWRWMIFDTDWGFTYSNHNTLKYVLNSEAVDTMNAYSEHPINHNQWNTSLLQQLLKNEEFKQKFLQRFDLYLTTVFETDYVINRINEMAEVIRPEIEEHNKRWELKQSLLGNLINYNVQEKNKLVNWEDAVEQLRQFAKERPAYIRQYLKEYFGSSYTVGD